MQSFKELINKPLINISRSEIAGYVKGGIFTKKFKSIRYLLIETEDEKPIKYCVEYYRARIGKDCILVTNENSIKPLLELDLSNYTFFSNKIPCISSDGLVIGDITDIILQSNSSKTDSILLNDEKLDNKKIVNDSSNLVIIQGEKKVSVKRVSKKIKKPQNNEPVILIEKLNNTALKLDDNIEDTENDAIQILEKNLENITPPLEKNPPTPLEKPIRVLANNHFMVNRIAKTTLMDFENNYIIKKGEKVTEQTIIEAFLKGKLLQLTLITQPN